MRQFSFMYFSVSSSNSAALYDCERKNKGIIPYVLWPYTLDLQILDAKRGASSVCRVQWLVVQYAKLYNFSY